MKMFLFIVQEIPNNQLHLGESGNYWDDTDNCDGSISYTKTSKLNEQIDKLKTKHAFEVNVAYDCGRQAGLEDIEAEDASE